VPVSGLTGVAAIAAGGDHSLALTASGAVWAWGSNRSGESSPPGGAFKSVSAGNAHTCGLQSDDTVTCWGDDAYGQLG